MIFTTADAGEGAAVVQVDEVGERVETVDQGQRTLVVQFLVIHPVEFVTGQHIDVMLAVVVRPGQGLLRIDRIVLLVVTPHHALFGTGRFAVFLGQVDVTHAVGLIERHTGIEGEVLEEFGFHVTDRRDVVLDIFRFGVIHLVLQVVADCPARARILRSNNAHRRGLLTQVANDYFVSVRIVHEVSVFVALVDRRHRVIPIDPRKYVLRHSTRVAGAITAVLQLGRPAAVRHVQSGFQPFGHLGIDI